MAINNYILDGIPLMDDQGRWFMEKTTGVRIFPAKRGRNLTYPGLDGETFISGATYEPGGVRISLYVKGATHGEFMENLEFWAGVLGQRSRLLPLVHTYSGQPDPGADRVAGVEIISTIEPLLINNRPLHALLEIPCRIPGVFWRSVNDITSPALAAGSAWRVHTLPHLGNAPVNDAIIQIRGGFSQLDFRDEVTHNQITIFKSIPSTNYVTIDTKNWIVRQHTSNPNFDTFNGTDISANVQSSKGRGTMWSVEPEFSLGTSRHRIGMSVINPSGSPSVQIRARKSFL